MLITVQNITWNYSEPGYYDEDVLGMSYMGIPPSMLKRFIKECGFEEGVPPHYDPYDKEDLKAQIKEGSEHECYNADTQIVLMNWLHDKRRKYNLDYRGVDPFWIFHDHCHSQRDVYGYEVSGIYSYIELQRLLEGAEMSKHNGIWVKPETVNGILNAWKPRFHYQEQSNICPISESDFSPLMREEDQEMLSYMQEMGIGLEA